MDNPMEVFTGAFGSLGEGMCRLGLNGQVAVKTSNGFKTYDVSTGRLTNVTQFCFDIGQEMFFVMPTTKAKRGDILLIDGKPKCVIENNSNKTIKVMDYENSAILEIVPERHVFMGQTYFYRKIVSMFGAGNFMKGEKGLGKVFKLMMMKEVLKGNSGNGMNGMNSLFGMAMMGQMFGEKDNDFTQMFDIDFDFDEDEAPDAETDDEKQARLEAELAALKTKKSGK